MSVRIDHRNSKVSVVFVLAVQGSASVGSGSRGTQRTEYEFSPSWDDPVAKIFGE